MEELRAESLSELGSGTGSIGRFKGASIASNHQQISVAVVTEFIRWNEEAVSRCNILSTQVIYIFKLFSSPICTDCGSPEFCKCYVYSFPGHDLWVSLAVSLSTVE